MLERRAIAAELRAGAGRTLFGYAARFNVEAELAGFTERIAPGAFRDVLAGGADVLALVDHNPEKLLGRTASRTLRLSEDAQGLAFELELPDTSLAADVLALARRGDLGGMSFGFIVPRGGDAWTGSVRELRRVELREISVVSAWPAYSQTEVAVRSRGAALPLDLARAWLATVRP